MPDAQKTGFSITSTEEPIVLLMSHRNCPSAAPVTGQGRRPSHPQRLWANGMDRELAVNQLKAFLFNLLHPLLENRIIFKFDGLVALDAN
jgi:hypothetical protein